MKNEKYIMSDKEIKLMHACKQLDTKTTSYVAEASECGVTERHMRRVYAKWRLGGTAELIHKSRKKPGKRKIPEETIDTVISFIKNELPGYNPAHAQEACAEELGIVLSVPTVRKYMRERNIKTGSYRAKPVVRQHRERKLSFGMMLQGDGSFHRWFGPEYPKCCLLVLIDDATNTGMARFSQEEEIHELLLLLKGWIETHGVPQSLYFDRRNAYVPTSDDTKHIPQVCDRLGIEIINANSPQAKGRVERANKTLQDRLCAELRRAGITTIQDGNRFLVEQFLPRFNKRFAKTAWNVNNAHVAMSETSDLDKIFGKRSVRTVCNDFTVHHLRRVFQVLKYSPIAIRPRAKIDIYEYLNNTVKVFYKGIELPIKEVFL